MELDKLVGVKGPIELKDLVGQHKLQGVDYGEYPVDKFYLSESEDVACCIRFKLDNVVYTCKEDPDDGYRSYCDGVDVEVGGKLVNEFADVDVVVEYLSSNGEDKKGTYSYEEWDVIQLVDCITGKVVLTVGTCNTDDYYPYYVGVYNPENMAVNIDR